MIEEKLNILDIYQKKLSTGGLPYKEKKVSSTFGDTNVLIFGDDGKPPLFLFHGLNSAVPFAFDSVSFLVKDYQVFAVDILGQPNKSEFVRLSKKDNSYGNWLIEITNSFVFKSFSLCGISFGAFPILQMLLIDEKRVDEVFLISPASIVNGSLLKTISRFLWPNKKFRKTKEEVYFKKCMNHLYDRYDELTYQFQKEVFLHFDMDFTVTPNFTPFQLQKIETPINIIASKDDFFVPAIKLKKRSVKNINSLKSFISLENNKHIPSKEVLKDAFEKFR